MNASRRSRSSLQRSENSKSMAWTPQSTGGEAG
jgi:hypothetical protein